ncbi:SDR family oxidoreductase [Lentisphaerota bacterium WC36G]|nr:SDR family oxidoreductase [Lentisphaerae bacterium WC36]
MNNLFNIQDKVIVVTGAAGALAGSTAKYLLKQGATVVFLDLNQERVDEVVEESKAISQNVDGYACNVLDKAILEDVYEKIMAKHGRVDVLINGAGGNMPGATVGPDQTIFDIKIDDYEKVLDLNIKGSVLPSLVFSKAFVEQKSGCIINFSSMSSTLALTRVMGYSNAKAAIDNFTRWFATEMAIKYGDGIRVNAIAPGFFIGNQNRKLLLNDDGTYTERGQQVIDNTPFRRFGEAEEVHGPIHYLISDAASFVTGTVIAVDGGFSIFSGV